MSREFFFEEPREENAIHQFRKKEKTQPEKESTRSEKDILLDLQQLGTLHAIATLSGRPDQQAEVLRRIIEMGVSGEIKDFDATKGGKSIRAFNEAMTRTATDPKFHTRDVSQKAKNELDQGASFWKGAESVVHAAKFLNQEFEKYNEGQKNKEHALGINIHLDTRHQVDLVDIVYDPSKSLIELVQLIQVKSSHSFVDSQKVLNAHQNVINKVFSGERIISANEQRRIGIEKAQSLSSPFLKMLEDYMHKKSQNPDSKPNIKKMVEIYGSSCGIPENIFISTLNTNAGYSKFENLILAQILLFKDNSKEDAAFELLDACKEWLKENATKLTAAPSPSIVPIKKAYSVIWESSRQTTRQPLTIPPKGSHLILLS